MVTVVGSIPTWTTATDLSSLAMTMSNVLANKNAKTLHWWPWPCMVTGNSLVKGWRLGDTFTCHVLLATAVLGLCSFPSLSVYIDEQTLIHTGLGFTALFTLFLCVVVRSQFSPYNLGPVWNKGLQNRGKEKSIGT
jgi:hypothetical protein